VKATIKLNLVLALVYASLAIVVVGSAVVASQQAKNLGVKTGGPVAAYARPKAASTRSIRPEMILVSRPGRAAVEFADARAVVYELGSVHRELSALEAAIGKDLAHGEFHAGQTRSAIRAAAHRSSRGPAGSVLATRRELDNLELALKRDLSRGDFKARKTRALLDGVHRVVPAVGSDAQLAAAVVTLGDDLWGLETSLEKDIHADDLMATETHFLIDGRRWKTD
jgi:hypothetical protein